jgi:hypothetical protein
MEFWLSGSLFHELFFFYDGILEIRNLGEDSFHIYITKSIYMGSASLKTLPLDSEPPLQGKEYGPPYSNATKKVKANVFPEITYRHVIRIFAFRNADLQKYKKYSRLLLATTGTFKGNTFSGCRHSTNMATLRQFAPSDEKPLACLFLLQCKAPPKIHEVFPGSPSFSSFSTLDRQF